jgi:integrase/recombinase XerC
MQSFIDYLELERKYSQHTVVAYKKDVSDFQAFVLQTYDESEIEDLSYPIIRSWIVSLVDSGLSARSVNRKVSSLKSYYKFLLKIGRIEINPLLQHKALKSGQDVQVPFSESEIDTVMELLKASEDFEGARDLLIVELLYSTGIRRAELIHIKMGDIGVSERILKVLGKRNKERLIPLLPSVVETYLKYLEYRNDLETIVDEEWLFLTSKGHKIYETLVYRVINSYFGKASEKVKKSPHILRHSFATHLLNEGANINAVKELLGHSSLASTQVYARNSIEKLKEVYRKAHPRNVK